MQTKNYRLRLVFAIKIFIIEAVQTLIRVFNCRAELGGRVYVADVTAGDEARHGDARRHARRLHPASRLQELPPEPSPERFKAPLFHMWRQSVGETLRSIQVLTYCLLLHKL